MAYLIAIIAVAAVAPATRLELTDENRAFRSLSVSLSDSPRVLPPLKDIEFVEFHGNVSRYVTVDLIAANQSSSYTLRRQLRHRRNCYCRSFGVCICICRSIRVYHCTTRLDYRFVMIVYCHRKLCHA